MTLDESHVLNQGVISYLQNSKGVRYLPDPIIDPDMHPDPYWNAGSHPEIVERIWDYFGSFFSNDCKAVVYGTPTLVHPKSGIVFAMAFGTEYAIRIPEKSMLDARRAGCRIEQNWTGGGTTNLENELGKDWVFGCWSNEEQNWLTTIYESL